LNELPFAIPTDCIDPAPEAYIDTSSERPASFFYGIEVVQRKKLKNPLLKG